MAPGRFVLAVLLSISAGVAAQPPSPPLPDQAAFFAEARKRLASNDLIQSHYSFRERTTELRLNPFGRSMGTGPVNVYEVYPHPEEELTYRRLIEHDGRPLSAEDLAEQDNDYRDKLASWQRRLAREGTSARSVRVRKAAEAKAKDEALAREALEMFDFRIAGRDTLEGPARHRCHLHAAPRGVAAHRARAAWRARLPGAPGSTSSTTS